MKKPLTIFVISAFLTLNAQAMLTGPELAALCKDYESFLLRKNYSWVFPNETEPCQAMPVFRRVQPGRAVVSVGTERSFIDAALTKAGSLYIVDVDPAVHIYGYINTLLLRITHTQQEYVDARFGRGCFSIVESWKHFCALDPLYAELSDVEVEALFGFWHTQIIPEYAPHYGYEKRTMRGFPEGVQSMMYRIRTHKGPEEFVNTNYLKDEAMWAHLKHLADSNKIYFVQANLGSEADMQKLVHVVKSNHDLLGLVDVSNVFEIDLYCCPQPWGEKHYMFVPHASIAPMMQWLSAASDEFTMLMSTSRATEVLVDDTRVTALDSVYPEIDFHNYYATVYGNRSWLYSAIPLVEMLAMDPNDLSSAPRCAASSEHLREVLWIQEQQPVFDCHEDEQVQWWLPPIQMD